MSKINISAFKSENEKANEYTAMVLLFQSVQTLASNKLGGWQLDHTYANNTDQEFITTYSNGKIIVKAHSRDGDHQYSVKSLESEE